LRNLRNSQLAPIWQRFHIGANWLFLTLRKNRLTNLSQILTEVSTPEYYRNPKGEDSSCNIDEFRAIYISKLKWAWQA
jgi:hypothetical protein